MPLDGTRAKRARSTLTPEPRSMRARAAAYSRVAQGKTDTSAARAGFLARFEREVDPDGVPSPAERAKRADAARKAYMTRLQLASSKARAARKQ